jgi:hypothetical protein
VNAKQAILILIITLGLVSLSGSATAQTQDYRFHWAPSPDQDEQGAPLPAAVGYEVWLREDAEPPRLVATVMGDTTYTLVAMAGVVSRIRVRGLSDTGAVSEASEWSEPIFFELGTRSGDLMPPAAALQGNYPNPFNPQTVIRYGVPASATGSTPIRLEIFTIAGRRVRSLDVDRTPGWHEAVWDGTDENGRVLATGMYVSRFVVGENVATGKMTMLK